MFPQRADGSGVRTRNLAIDDVLASHELIVKRSLGTVTPGHALIAHRRVGGIFEGLRMYREDLMKRINEKVRNKETHTLTEASGSEKPRKSAEIIDLMAVLKQSLEKGGSGRRRPAHPKLGKRKSASR